MMTIALHRPGAIGDILMGLNVVPELHKRFPDAIIHYFCHPSYGEALSPILRDAGVSDWKSSLDLHNGQESGGLPSEWPHGETSH